MAGVRVNESEVDKQFAKVLSELFGQKVTIGQAQEAQDAYQALISENLGAGKNVSLHGFGIFELQHVPAKSGISFGKRYNNEPYKKVKFRAFKALDEAINMAEEEDVDAPLPLPVPDSLPAE